MTKIFKQLGRHWAACLAVVALLVVQAYCDLSLPDYTSKIVDTGIQQGGIESPVPDTVRDTTLQALELLMSEQDAVLAEQWYSAPDADGVRTLSHDATAAMSELESAFITPDIVLYMAAAQNAATAAGTTDTVTPTSYDLDAVATQFAAMAQAPGAREMLQAQLADAAPQDDSVADSLSSQAMLLVALEYDAQGIAHDVQMSYLLRTGGQMLALTLLMVAVAIAVGFIASRVSAAIGRDLRRDVFKTVVGYSNAEIEKFSTASLITRTTNDIQQVQFTCVILLRMVAYAPILGIGGILHVASGNTGLEWIIFVAVAALLALIAGIEHPSGGEVLVDGEPVRAPTGKAGLMPQRDQLFDWRTIWGNVTLGLEVRHENTPEHRGGVHDLLEQYQLAGFARKLPNQLSGGMRQRCALIRTLATSPDVLLLDEPFSALDYQTRLAVSGDISQIIRREHKTALLVTHDISEAISLSDRIVVLSHPPATFKAIHELGALRTVPPLERRSRPEFQALFNQIWEELDVNV